MIAQVRWATPSGARGAGGNKDEALAIYGHSVF